MPNAGSTLSGWWSTEWEFHVEHEVEEHTEGPHVYLEAVETRLVAREDLRGHELLGTEDSATYVSFFLAEPEICQLEALRYQNLTSFPF